MGYCVDQMIGEIEYVQDSIKNFSIRSEGMSDDFILFEAEELVEGIKRMIDTKKCVNEELGYNRF